MRFKFMTPINILTFYFHVYQKTFMYIRFSNAMMDLNDYQIISRKFAVYPHLGSNLVYTGLGLSGEVGEFNEHIKKSIRDGQFGMGYSYLQLDPTRRLKMIDELGDVLWYVANCATELGVNLSDVAAHNLDKLRDRKVNGKKLGHEDIK